MSPLDCLTRPETNAIIDAEHKIQYQLNGAVQTVIPITVGMRHLAGRLGGTDGYQGVKVEDGW